MRLAAMGRVPCKRCSGSGIHKSPTLTARVCGACGGRGYTIPRELSSGSWFEPEQKRPCACGECGACVERVRSAERRSGTREPRRAFNGRRGVLDGY